MIKEFVPGDPDGAEAWTKAFTEEAGKFFGVYEYRGITEIMDVFQDGEHAYMAMEYLPGKNLDNIWKAEKEQITAENAWTLLLRHWKQCLFSQHRYGSWRNQQWSG